MNLRDAALCLDCSEVYSISERACPKCASASMMPLDKTLPPPLWLVNGKEIRRVG